jgi:hypothetical protein
MYSKHARGASPLSSQDEKYSFEEDLMFDKEFMGRAKSGLLKKRGVRIYI